MRIICCTPIDGHKSVEDVPVQTTISTKYFTSSSSSSFFPLFLLLFWYKDSRIYIYKYIYGVKEIISYYSIIIITIIESMMRIVIITLRLDRDGPNDASISFLPPVKLGVLFSCLLVFLLLLLFFSFLILFCLCCSLDGAWMLLLPSILMLSARAILIYLYTNREF